MARRRPRVEAPLDDADLILPRELVELIPYDSRENADRLNVQHQARGDWMAAHGVDRRDWDRWHRILTASREAHGIDDHRWTLIVEPDSPRDKRDTLRGAS